MANNQSHPGISSPPAHTPPQSVFKKEAKELAERAKRSTSGFDFMKLFVGRLDRENYFYGAVSSIMLSLIVWQIPIFGLVISFVLLVLGLGITARRLHDINVPGLVAMILFVPVVGLLAILYLSWRAGDAGGNTFGAVPDKKREMFRAWRNT